MAEDVKILEERCNNLNTYLFNLVVYSPVKQRSPYFHHLVEQIVSHFPSRILFIEGDAEKSEITTEYHEAQELSSRCDQIIFHVPKHQRDKVSFILLPHLLPDLPVVLLWGQDPTTEHTVLPHLIKFSNRLIFDSDCAENLQTFSQRILEQAETTLIDLIDLNWARIKGWREAFSEIFDTPARLSQITLAKQISVHYNGISNEYNRMGGIQPFYLQNWLATQLGWKPRHCERDQTTTRLTYFNGVNDLTVELNAETNPQYPSGSILGIQVNAAENHTFTLKYQPGADQGTVHISSQEICELPFCVMISGPRLRYQFLKDLMYGRSSSQYFNMMDLLSQQGYKQ